MPDPRIAREASPVALALAFASTIRGSEGSRDEISSAADLGAWLERQRDILGDVEPEVALRLADFRVLREAIRTLFLTAAGERFPAEAVRAVNEVSAAVPTHLRLVVSDPREPKAALESGGGSRTAEILAAVARSAIGILGGPERARLRACPAPRCGSFFITTRAGQVWCSSACGNRVRVARHHSRTIRS